MEVDLAELGELAPVGGAPHIIPTEVNRDDAFQALHKIFDVFIDFFLHEHTTFAVPQFHRMLWALMVRIDLKRVAIAAPRGHAKTTLAKLVCVWYFLFSPIKFIVYLSNTADAAVKAVQDIVEFFENENFKKLFGPVVYEVNKFGDGEFIFTLTTPFHGTKKCILKARGMGQQVRGLNIKHERPQLAVGDDLEDVEDLENLDIRAKRMRWFFGTFVKAMDRRFNKIIIIGNLLDHGCILKQLVDSPVWYSVVLGAITKEGLPLWPEMWPLEQLTADYEEYRRLGLSALWYAEMMNLIVAGENALISPDEIVYLPPPEEAGIPFGFITIDPATGQGQDDTAVVVHLLIPLEQGGYLPQIVDYAFGQLDEKATIDKTIELCFKWGIRVIGVESIGFQRTYLTLFNMVFAVRNLTDIEVVKTYPAASSKLMRIRGWCALLKDKAYALTTGEMYITTQLLAFDPAKKNNKDDLIDSCAQGQEMMERYLGLILSKKRGTSIDITPMRETELA